MRLPIYQVDAFTDRPFSGNPAAVMPLSQWLSADVMQSIAAENNLSETAFFVAEGDGYRIRWFTPAAEVDLCGHATLASAHVIFAELAKDLERIHFQSKSGSLFVTREEGLLCMDFPSLPPRCIDPMPGLAHALGVDIEETWEAEYVLALLDSEATVKNLCPNMSALLALGSHEFIITAKGESADFVSRFFAPSLGISEDPVTGSAHCRLIPFWAQRLGKSKLRSLQLSPRGGELFCELKGDRVKIAGKAVKVMEGFFVL